MTPGLEVGWAEHFLGRHWGSDILAQEPREQTSPQGCPPWTEPSAPDSSLPFPIILTCSGKKGDQPVVQDTTA